MITIRTISAVLLYLVVQTSFSARDAREDSTFVKGKTPILASRSIPNVQKKNTNIRLEVHDNVPSDDKAKSLYSIGGDPLGYETNKKQEVHLVITVTNVSQQPNPNLKIIYKVFGRITNYGTSSAVKVGERRIEDQGQFELNEPLRFLEGRMFKTKPVSFSSSQTMHRFTDSRGYWVNGEKYNGYEVELFDDKNNLVAVKKN